MTNPAKNAEPLLQRERLFARMRDQIAAGDPAFSRLRLSARAILSLALSECIMALVLIVHTPPAAAFALAAVMSFICTIGVRAPTQRAQIVTRALAAIAGVAAIFVSSQLAPMQLAASIVFLCVIFAAVYVRRFGPRWFVVGMVAFMGYFLGDFLRPSASEIAWVGFAAAIAAAFTHLVSNFILPDDPESDFRRAVVTIDRRINLILRALLHAAEHGGASEDERRELSRHVALLRETILMAEGYIRQGEDGSLAAEGPASELAVTLFDLQLSVEQMVKAARVSLPPAHLIRAAIRHEGEVLDRAAAATAREDARPLRDKEMSIRLIDQVSRSWRQLGQTLGEPPSEAFVHGGPNIMPPPPTPPLRPVSFVPQTFQAPIQVTLACALAMAGGVLVSSAGWYWAVITAFIVFNNARSRADTAMKALQRSVGTLAGLAVGAGAAVLLHGQPVISGIAIVALFALAFYFVQTAYGVMIFFITVAVALLYGLAGRMTPDILVLRLEETIIGGLAGALVAFFVFPVRTSVGAAASLDRFLDALSDLVRAAHERLRGERGGPSLLAMSRRLDRAYADLAIAARPLGGPWGAVTRFGEIRQKLLPLSAAVHWARVLARSCPAGAHVDEAALTRFEAEVVEVNAMIDAARDRRETFFESANPTRAIEAQATATIAREEDPAMALQAIGGLLRRVTPQR
ncbi:MAG: FUSC family protein [Rhodobiaceae bacterium]|nr:FUSC family protein [Rhodobiaceae bacterium]MCC0056020.1 FUSC family protein [Rhodobiaceae bacterium]